MDIFAFCIRRPVFATVLSLILMLLGVGLDFGDHRFGNFIGQAAAHAGNAVTHVAGGGIGIDFRTEPDRDASSL